MSNCNFVRMTDSQRTGNAEHSFSTGGAVSSQGASVRSCMACSHCIDAQFKFTDVVKEDIPTEPGRDEFRIMFPSHSLEREGGGGEDMDGEEEVITVQIYGSIMPPPPPPPPPPPTATPSLLCWTKHY